MANCDDLNQQLAEIDAQLAELDRLEGLAKARMANRAMVGTGKAINNLRDLNGKRIAVTREYWEKTSEQMLLDKGDGIYDELARMGFNGAEGPRGDAGRMINYGLEQKRQYTIDYDRLEPSDQHAYAVLEMMGIERRSTKEGQKLMVRFTQEKAIQALQQMARQGNVPVTGLAKEFATRFRNIRDLPRNVVRLAQARWESASQFANVLEEAADSLDMIGAVTPEVRARLGAAATWASYFENLDAVVRRKIGQSLRAMRFDLLDKGDLVIDFNDEWTQLTLSDVKGETLLQQVLEDVEKGDKLKLRRLAAAARVNPVNNLKINSKGFLAQVALLNNFRRANMLTSVKSWLGRNPASGLLVGAWYGAEDVVAGSFRVGAWEGLKASAFASRAAIDASAMATRNALTFLSSGKATIGNNIENTFETAASLVQREAQFVDDALTRSLEDLQNPVNYGNPVVLLNLLNASYSKVMGRWLFPKTGDGLAKASQVFGKQINPELKDFFDNGGYMPAFRLLGAADEAVRTMAFAWKTNHEAFIRAVENAPKGTASDVIERQADEAASKALYSGFMTDEELRQFRFAKGLSADGDVDNDTLRLIAFNELNGMPRVTNDPEDFGTMGVQRASDITFTQTIKDPILQGIGVARQNALVAWELPFYRTPMNSLLWTIDRGPLGMLQKTLQLQKLDPEKVSAAKLAETKAQLVVSTAFFTLASAAILNGTFESGGPRDPQEWARWRRNHTPYSWNLGFMKIEAARFSMAGIDPMDLLGLYADLHQLVWVDGITKGQFDDATQGLVIAFSRLLENKASLKSVTTILSALTEPDRTDIADVVAAQMGGLLPLSGIAGNLAQAGRDPAMSRAKRRMMSPDELKALETDPIWAAVAPVLNVIQDAAERVARQYPGLNQLVKMPEDYDWIGWKVKRPFGVPLEAFLPYMPVILPNDPLAKWLEQTGFTAKPNADGKLKMPSANADGSAVELTLMPDEERKYRSAMRELVGAADVEGVLDKTPDWDITPYVNGKNLMGALRALKNDPRYQQFLEAVPGGPFNPDKRKSPTMTMAGRKSTELYRPVQDIIDYYDKRAQIHLITGDDEVSKGFLRRYQGLVRVQSERLLELNNALSPLGRQ